MTNLSLTEACEQLKQGNIIAYPTEAVFGLGCDPDCEQAVLALLKLKQRPIEKGLILIASDYEQLLPYIDEKTISTEQKQQALASWPGPVTWIIPKNANTPYFLTGKFNSIAVRITDHPFVRELCDLFGKPIVSTSANISGQDACRTIEQVESQFGHHFLVLEGKIGKRNKPSEIREIKTGKIIRQG